MEAVKVAGLAVAAAFITLLLRRVRPENGLLAAMAGGALLLLAALPALREAVGGVAALAEGGGVADTLLYQLLKVAGVSLLMDFAAQTCRDAGEDGLAVKTELAGRLMLLGLALPAMRSLLAQLRALAP